MARVALVTGGTRGIGAAICKALKASGYKVAATYGGNDEAAQKFRTETGVNVYKWDVSSFDACAAGVKQVEADLGPVDVLVNNAGITRDAQLHRMKPEQWTEVINTNLGSLFNMCRQVIEGMRERKFGRIINISSINGQKGQFGQTNYSAAKAGEIGFTKALAQEGARAGITVNAVCPGYIATDMVKAMSQEVLQKNILPQIPIGRLGEPEEIARCVIFLASDDAGLITGSTLTANGGQYFTEFAAPIYFGCHSFGASSKLLKSKPGATVQPTKVQSPSDCAACHAWAGTTACGCSPATRSLPNRTLSMPPASDAISSCSGAPACQCHASTASTRCQCERSPRASRK